MNTIPDRVTFSIDLRHPEAATLKAIETTFNEIAQQTWAGCRVTLTLLSRIEPVVFPDALTVQICATLMYELLCLMAEGVADTN